MSDTQLLQHIERIEGLMSDKSDIMADIKDEFTLAKGNGYDPKAMKEVIKLRAMDKDARDNLLAVVELYKEAVGV